MIGLPARCNTRADYDYIRASQIDGWQEHWRQLLEGRHAVIDGDLVEDPHCRLFALGFTVAEVEQAVGPAGYTSRQVEWYSSHPDRYELVDEVWREIEGWRERANAAALLAALEDKLAEVDAAVAARQAGTFTWSGHQFYMDRDYISDQIAALPHLPDGYSREWKTADKIGVDNVYVVLDKDGLASMAMACFSQFNTNWSAGDDIKKRLKALYAAGKDVSAIAVDLP
jgi:hypothetical protein